MRLIDADALIEFIVEEAQDLRTLSTKTVGQAISKTPTIDAVPVIRCKDCYFYIDGYCDNNVIYQMMSGDLIGVYFEPHEDFYCAMAERKEE